MPTTPDYLPPPIAWRTCDTTLQPKSIACRQMVEDWPLDTTMVGISPLVTGYVRPDGVVVLMFGRFSGTIVYRIISEADGPVYQAILETGGCTLGGYSAIADGKYVYYLYPGPNAFVEVALAGNVTDFRPSVYLDFWQSPEGRDFVAGLPGVLEENAGQQLILHDWADASKTTLIWSPAQDNGLQQTFPFFLGSALFWSSSSLSISKIKVYTTSGGVADLVGFGNDTLRGADDLGTDGHDLVWNEADGRVDGGAPATASVMTSPYTTDPNAVVPRRLRSDDPGFFGSSYFKVGCGYAARFTQLGTWGDLIVRLSDGQSWFLTSSNAAWNWVDPIAITCDEFFAVVALQGATRTIVRVRLDSLGPGSPPD